MDIYTAAQMREETKQALLNDRFVRKYFPSLMQKILDARTKCDLFLVLSYERHGHDIDQNNGYYDMQRQGWKIDNLLTILNYKIEKNREGNITTISW